MWHLRNNCWDQIGSLRIERRNCLWWQVLRKASEARAVETLQRYTLRLLLVLSAVDKMFGCVRKRRSESSGFVRKAGWKFHSKSWRWQMRCWWEAKERAGVRWPWRMPSTMVRWPMDCLLEEVWWRNSISENTLPWSWWRNWHHQMSRGYNFIRQRRLQCWTVCWWWAFTAWHDKQTCGGRRWEWRMVRWRLWRDSYHWWNNWSRWSR